MQKKVYFTGTLPRKGRVPFGGGEVGNMRTIAMLRAYGYEVMLVRRIISTANDSKMTSLISYPVRMIINLIQWFGILIFASRKNGLAHISGFYGNTILIETFQIVIAKLLGHKIIYELRGGGAINFYKKGSYLYRAQFRYIIRTADFLSSQGAENVPFLRTLCDTPIHTYPNYVQSGSYPHKTPLKPVNNINLIFFGRIEKYKNPLMIVEITSILQKSFNNIRLTMVGNGQEDLIKKVEMAMQQVLLPGSFVLMPGVNHEKMKDLLGDKHFFIFPSEQPREGVSNALIEAMSYGIIPIASPQGFNRSTIGDDSLIINEIKAELYASRIAAIIQNNEIDYYSRFVHNRFLDNFTETIVVERTIAVYDNIFRNKLINSDSGNVTKN